MTVSDFRRTRRSNDAAGWVLAILMTAALTGFFVLMTAGEVGPESLCVLPFAFLFLATAAFFSIRQLVYPHELELVVEDGVIRWGRTDQPDCQDRLRLAEVKRWMIHRFDCELFGDTGCVILKPVGRFILSIDDIGALIAFLKERHANICVVDTANLAERP